MTDFNIEYYGTVTSTNDIVKRRALQGEHEGFAAVADSQTSGRGRLGRVFVSHENCGLYMSVLLRPHITSEQLMRLTAMTACEVSAAVGRVTGIETSIKWVNDLLYNGKKVCGILVETGFQGSEISYAVVGIGINLTDCGISREIDGAGALGCGTEVRRLLASEITRGVIDGSKKLGTPYFIDDYRRKSCVIGRRINVIKNGISRPAFAEDITDDAFLSVRYEDGTREVLSSFEISVRNA